MNPSENFVSTSPQVEGLTAAETLSVYDLLSSLSRKILEETDISQVLRVICEEGCRLLGADRALVIRLTGSDTFVNREVLYAHKVPREYIELLKADHHPSFVSEVLAKGQLGIISDIYEGSRLTLRDMAKKAGFRAVCTIPLRVKGESFAGLVLYYLNRRTYTENERKLAKTLGDLASLAIEKASLTQNIRQKAAQSEVVGRIAKVVGSTLEPEKLFETILNEIQKAVPCDRCIIASIDRETNRYHTLHIESKVEMGAREQGFDGKGDIWDQAVYEEKRVLVIDDLRDVSAHRAKVLVKAGLRSSMTVPILREGECIAHLGLSSVRPGFFTESDKELLISIADHLGPAIRNATLYREMEVQKNRLAKLVEINQRLTRGQDLQSLLDSLVQAAVELLQGDHSRLFLFDEEREILVLGAWSGEMPDTEYVERVLNEQGTIAGRVFRTGKETVIHDIQKLKKDETTGWFRENNIRSCIVYPLFKGSKIIGVINCLSEKRAFFSREDLELLGSFAAQAAVAIEDNRLFHEARDHGTRQEIIASIAKAVGSTMKPEELFKTIVREIRKAVPCERSVIATIDRETGQFHCWHIESEIELGPRVQGYDTENDWWDREIYEEDRGVIIDDLRNVSFSRAREMVEAGFRSTMAVPILQNGNCIAHIGLTSTREKAFTNNEMEFLSAIADHLGPAIRNTTLFQESEEQRRRLTIQNRIAKAVGSTMEPQELFETIVREIRKAVPCERCIIAAIDRETSQYHTWHTESEIEMAPRKQGYDTKDDWWDMAVYEENRAVIIDDLREVSFPRGREMVEAGFRSTMSVPILQNEKCIAHIGLTSTREKAFTKSDKDFLIAIADHLGPAIRNATLFQESEGQRKRLTIQNRIAEAVGSTLEPRELFKIIVREIREDIPSDRCTIATYDEMRNQYIRCYGDSTVDVEPRKQLYRREEIWWDDEVYERG